MKKIILSFTVILITGIYTQAQNVNIPDANFKAYLVGNSAINTNSDTEIQVSEANSFSGSIDCSNLSISDLTGIESFVALTSLTCIYNQLTNVNLSNNIALVGFYCNFNQITILDLSNNTALAYFACINNQLTSLNIKNGNNANFGQFQASSNSSLSCIEVDNVAYSTTNWTDIDAATSFSEDCSSFCIVDIPDANFKAYLVGNSAINTNSDSEIQCDEASSFTGTLNCNGLSIADATGIEAFTSLTGLQFCCNQLTSLDVSGLPDLTAVWCSVNQLTSLNVANGNNTNFTMYYFDTNPNLECIEVDDVAYSTANWTNLDVTASYSEDCGTLGINGVFLENLIVVYPNPTSGTIFLSDKYNVILTDLTGNIMVQELDTNSVDISTQPEGMYFISLSDSKGNVLNRSKITKK